MKSPGRRIGAPELLILTGSCLFIFVLWLSAYFEPDIRWLHFFQAWMYLAAAWLLLGRSRWGFFIGLSAAGLWDYINLFVTTFFRHLPAAVPAAFSRHRSPAPAVVIRLTRTGKALTLMA